MKMLFFDFETLGTNIESAPIVNLATVKVESDRFTSDSPYNFNELVNVSSFHKFDILEQVNVYGRKIEQRVLDWWQEQPPTARKQLKRSSDDVSIKQLFTIFNDEIRAYDCKYVFTRGNTFDPPLLTSLIHATDQSEPIHFRAIRDVRSFILGLTFGHNIDDRFFPPNVNESEFIHHDSRHDVAIDVMRIQYLIRTMEGLDV